MKLNHYRISKTKFQRVLKDIEKVKNLRMQAVFEPTDKSFGHISELIVNNKQELNEHYAYRKFWSLYGKEFLRFREGKEVKECKTEVERRRKNLLEHEGSILKHLIGILNPHSAHSDIDHLQI